MNRMTLAGLDEMPIGEISKLPIAQLAMLLEDVADIRAQARRYDEILTTALDHRCGEAARQARQAQGKDAGRVRLAEADGFEVVADVARKIEWSEEGLAELEAQLAASGETTNDYIKVKRSVSEAAFARWPTSLRKMFEPHRVVSLGKPSYAIEQKAKD